MRRLLSLLLFAIASLSLLSAPPFSAAEAAPKSKAASTKKAKRSASRKSASSPRRSDKAYSEPKAKPFRGVCRVQRARKSLKRESFVRGGQLQADAHNRALKWRIERYGRIEGVPFEKLNPKSAYSHAKPVRFMGLPLTVHEKIAPALTCVEKRIRKTCNGKGRRYVPKAVGGFRQGNTYRGGEVSNHLFGIAVDIDPERNPCCGCVDPWPNHPACKKETKKVVDKAELTQCWIDAFERYGFYWLGRDTLEDTMHFEFLGDPDRIIP